MADADFTKNEAVELSWLEDDVARLTMTRGSEMNTLTHGLLEGMNRALDTLAKKPVRALVITGSGRAFCCGAHLDYFTKENMEEDVRFRLRDHYLAHIARVFDRLEEQRYPTIAAINGFALGGGCELALSCDFRIMSTKAKIGLPEVKLGALAGAGGVQKLGRHIGRSKAIEWILLGLHASAEEAERRGLLYASCAPDELEDKTMELVRSLKALSPMAIAQSKAAVYMCEDADLGTARRIGLEALGMLIDSRDWKEGIAAFHSKRDPVFRS